MATNILIPLNGTVKLGPTATATDVSCQVSNASLTATPNPKTITTLCGITTAAGLTAGVLHLEAAQDWAAGGISMFLVDNAGQLVDFEVVPTDAAAGPKAVGQCYITPGSFSGAAGEIATLTVDLGCEGEPTFTAATPAATAARREPVAA